MDPSDVSLNFDLGRIENAGSQLRMSLRIQADGQGMMGLYVHEEGKRNGQFFFFNLDDYNAFRRIMRKTDDLLKELSETQKLKKLGW